MTSNGREGDDLDDRDSRDDFLGQSVGLFDCEGGDKVDDDLLRAELEATNNGVGLLRQDGKDDPITAIHHSLRCMWV